MKNKILLSTLLGGALLAGCTADDALDVSKNVAEKVNPAAPVFTVSFYGDADQTRAISDEGGNLKWELTDKMSLYHGGGLVTGSGENWKVGKFGYGEGEVAKHDSRFLDDGQQVRKFDAIYTGSEDGETFKTAAMVNEGLAIMIYPADTVYAQTKNNPHILLTNEQDENTKLNSPYVSEMLEITEYSSMKDNEESQSAGYGRNYKLRLRPIGGTLRLKLNGTGAEKLTAKNIPVPDFRKVKIEVATENGVADPFTTEMCVRIGQERRNAGEEGGSEWVGTNTPEYKNWKYSPWIVPADANDLIGELAPRTNWISTTDIVKKDDAQTAHFTLLPYEDRTDVDKVITEDEDGTLTAHYGDVTITVETEYGKVTIKSTGDEDDDELWSNSTGSTKYTIKGGLTYVLNGMFKPNATKGGLYEGQLVARTVNHQLNVDLSDLDMNNLHIKDQENLNKVLDVYEALEKTQKIRLILDGDKDGSKKFYMDKATWERVAELMAVPEKDKKITFAACDDEKPCTTIVLKNTTTENVPALAFDNAGWTSTGLIQGTLTVELAEGTTWTFDATEDEAKIMTKVKTLVVAEGATLNLTDTYVNVDNGMTSKSNAFELVNNGTVNIKGDAYLMEKMTNHGRIYIPANEGNNENRFLMDEGGELTNSEDAVYDRNFEEGWWTLTPENETSVLKNAGGVIDNHGTLAIVTGLGGKIYNYGTINLWETTARTLITANQDTNANIAQAYSSTNRFGTINLQKAGVGVDNLTIQTNLNGFVKYATSVGATCGLANYAVVDTEDIPAKTYIEIQYSAKELKVSGALSPTALIIPKGRSIFLPNTTGASLKVDKYIYLKGSITHAKDVTGSFVLEGYFGGDAEKDKKNMFSMN